MRIKIKAFWNHIFTSYWFIPGILLLAAIGLSFASLFLDRQFSSERFRGLWFVVFSQPDGARSVLSTIASSMISVAGVTFSITMVVLSLASSQFGPRLLRNFMRDRGSQMVLGVFLATFLYCLLILRTVQEGEYSFVPHISITVALVLAIVNIAVFIYFIHHTAESIRVSTVIERVSGELTQRIERFFQTPGYAYLKQDKDVSLPDDFEDKSKALAGETDGYLQDFDHEVLCQLAQDHDLIIQLPHRIGDFIALESSLIRVYPKEHLDEKLEKALCEPFVLGAHRVQTSDVGLLLDQIVEIALRALSPGVNDPFTALACLDRIGEALSMLIKRDAPGAIFNDDAGEPRLYSSSISLAEFVYRSLSVIRPFATNNMLVYAKLLQTLSLLEQRGDADLDAVLAQERDLVLEKARQDLPEHDIQRLEASS